MINHWFQIIGNTIKHIQNHLLSFYHITHHINTKNQKLMINHWFQINGNTIKHIQNHLI